MNRTEKQPVSEGAHPWDEPGFSFSIGWPRGYEAGAVGRLLPASTSHHAAAARKGRESNNARLTGWRNGTLTPLSAKSDPAKRRPAPPPTPAPKKKAVAQPPAAPKPPKPVVERVPLQDSARTVARQKGLDRYFTGVPCSHGHVAERFVRNATCVECERLRKVQRTADARAKREARA